MHEIDAMLKQAKKVHMIGIGGAGMCALAEILVSQGYTLTGSDNNESDNLQRMKNLGIPIKMGHSADNIGDADMVVYTAALLSDNVELMAAKETVPTFERSILLGAVSRMFCNCIGVCGTHGKTTVSSMLTQVLLTAGLDPSAVIGGKLPMMNANGRVGSKDLFVVEACEFVDTFLEITPKTAVILNIDEDHMDYFKTMENLKRSFRKFAAMADTLILNGDDEHTMDAVKELGDKKRITYGISDGNDFQAKSVLYEGGKASFDVYKYGQLFVHIDLNVPGVHNVSNALAAIASADLEGADAASIKEGLESFGGAGRRFEILAEIGGITIADDYAHHPAELKVTLEAAMDMNYRKVWAVFQPFTYSRTATLLDDFATVLSIPDACVLSEIMGSREINTYDIYAKDLCDKIPGCVWFPEFDEIADYVIAHAEPGDLVITLGCGDIYKAAKLMIHKMKK